MTRHVDVHIKGIGINNVLLYPLPPFRPVSVPIPPTADHRVRRVVGTITGSFPRERPGNDSGIAVRNAPPASWILIVPLFRLALIERKTSELWVRVQYRGNDKGWVLTANKRGPILSPVEASPSAAAQEFQAQETAAAAAAAAALKAKQAADDEDENSADKKGAVGKNRSLEASRGASQPAADVPGGGAAAGGIMAGGGGQGTGGISAGQFMTSAGYGNAGVVYG